MYPIGTKVVIRSVDHLGREGRPPRRLLGKTGVVTFHDDGMHEVAVIHGFKGRGVSIGLIRWMFDTEHLELFTEMGV